jgi:HK97 family phage major capsid protein
MINVDQKRFEAIKKMEQKELFQLSRKELQEAASMGDTRCEHVEKELELDDLRKFKQEKDALEAAEKKAEEIANEIIDKNKEVDSEIEEKVNNLVEEKLKEGGVNLGNKYARRLIEQKMHYDQVSANKSVYANTQYGREVLSPEVKSFVDWAKTGKIDQKAALVGTTDANGGYLVPQEFHNEILRKMKDFVVVRTAGAKTISMSRDSMAIPTVESNGSGGWRGKAQGQAYTQSEPTFGEIVLEPKKYDRLALSSYEMLEDEAVNVADLLSDIFAEDFSEAEDDAFIAGAGVDDPEGIDTNANISSVALGTEFTISAQDVYNIIYALKRKYRSRGAWFIHDQVVAKLRGLKSNGAFLWTDGNLANGEPNRLGGYPVYTSEALLQADVDSGTPTAPGSNLIFGAPRYYYIGDRQGFRLRRSAERYFETGQVAFAGDLRVDGKVALPEAFVKSAPVKH